MVNKFQVRISVIESKPVQGPGAVFGQRSPDKLLDASFTTDSIGSIRDIVDGLLYEGIPETQTDEEMSDRVQKPMADAQISPPIGTLMAAGASGQVTVSLPPTVEASGDVARVPSRVQARDEPCADPSQCGIHGHEYGGREGPSDFPLRGGKHSGNCSCKGCEPILPGEVATIVVPPLGDDGDFEPPIGRETP